jgi:histone acetyltransferase (RNA polymerase elongator complex component)
MLKHYTIPIFIPELACPFQCVFCNQEKISGHQKIPDKNDIQQTITEHLKSFKRTDRIVEVGFFGGSFTGIPIEEQAHYLETIQPFVKQGEVQGIRLSTRPDYISEEILVVLKKYRVSTIELGAQSMDDEVLTKTFRGHTAKQTEEASKMILENGFELGLQMMIGLPGDTLEKSIITAKRIIELGAANTRIYPAVVIKGTAMHSWYTNGKYTPLSIDEAIQWSAQILPLFEEAEVKVLRVGLHPSEGLLSGHELVAGPFHQSFKELVLTEIWKQKLSPLLTNEPSGKLTIFVAPEEMNYAIGYGAANKKMFLEKCKTVEFMKKSSLSGRNFEFSLA